MSDDGPRIIGPRVLGDSMRELWDHGLTPGDKTGWPSLDRHYTVAPGQISIVTGWPSSGKSEWLDALLVNLARQGWRFAVFSPENQPIKIHAAKLMEKLAGRPFSAGPNARIERDAITEWLDEMGKSFAFVEAGGGMQSPESILDAVGSYFRSFQSQIGPKRGVVIDPWNELEHWRPQGLSETEYISKTLSLIRAFARDYEAHVWIVAHPQKLKRDDGKLPVPTPDSISGSAHFWNKADCAITVYRDLSDTDSQDVTIFVQKIRFKHIGRAGKVTLKWDRVTGRYHESFGSPRVAYGAHKE